MEEFKTRDAKLGKLIVIGGPGGSGASTIAKRFATHFSLNYVYGGKLMRDFAKKNGFSSLTAFLKSDFFKEKQLEFDSFIDSELMEQSSNKDVLIDSKVFAALATKNKMPCTVKIWITASLETRVARVVLKKGGVGNTQIIRENLQKRYEKDRERFNKLYDVQFEKPDLYNDIVIDSSRQNPDETFNLILKLIKDKGYIENS